MEIIDTPLKEVKIIQLQIHGDNRGFFVERFNEEKFKAIGMPTHFSQDNHSRSAPGILRGLHYQFDKPQGKLVGAVRGRIWDVAVDIRPDSPTLGQWFGTELSDENGRLLWVPAGFAHGFCVLGDGVADVSYKVTNVFNAEGEGGIAWNDEAIGVDWPIDNPTLSERDKTQQSFEKYKQNPPRW